MQLALRRFALARNGYTPMTSTRPSVSLRSSGPLSRRWRVPFVRAPSLDFHLLSIGSCQAHPTGSASPPHGGNDSSRCRSCAAAILGWNGRALALLALRAVRRAVRRAISFWRSRSRAPCVESGTNERSRSVREHARARKIPASAPGTHSLRCHESFAWGEHAPEPNAIALFTRWLCSMDATESYAE